ncbi:TIR domain-containing protein [Cytophaga sp. FL35]|uniref:TIR domain-containing protein n=1 Tax=Cytophaga sp. FL35 TaxID=1904456 RepID=UPI001653E9FE|nr:TIR domain-containing protein [Cytophaga sp. FL35]MBC6999959.1 toll/interleukin-1 receptor domain-containing protein [Cytophaga sp. FL35]
MKIFLSWSGNKSKLIAESLREWLEQVIQSTEPWISTSIEKGKKWSKEISDKLEESKVGIICLTRENLNAPWILFEAGAISKSSDSYVCTFLTDISSPTEITGPLSSFQHTKFQKEELLKLLRTINSRIKESKGGKSLNEKSLEDVFEIFYPKLETRITEILEVTPEQVAENNIRSDRELLEEIVESQRSLKERINDLWTNKDIDSIVDHYVSNYVNSKGLGSEYDIVDEPHLSDFSEKLGKNPLIRKLFANSNDFKDFVKEKYLDLPF